MIRNDSDPRFGTARNTASIGVDKSLRHLKREHPELFPSPPPTNLLENITKILSKSKKSKQRGEIA